MALDQALVTATLANGVFAVLFVWLLRETRADARRREEILMAELKRLASDAATTARVLDGVIISLTALHANIHELSRSVDRICDRMEVPHATRVGN